MDYFYQTIYQDKFTSVICTWIYVFWCVSIFCEKPSISNLQCIWYKWKGEEKKVRGPRWSKWATLVNSSRSGMSRVIRHEQNELYLILSGVAKNLRGRVDSCFRAVSHAMEFLYPAFVPYPPALVKHPADVASPLSLSLLSIPTLFLDHPTPTFCPLIAYTDTLTHISRFPALLYNHPWNGYVMGDEILDMNANRRRPRRWCAYAFRLHNMKRPSEYRFLYMIHPWIV